MESQNLCGGETSKKNEDGRDVEMTCLNSESCGVYCLCDQFKKSTSN